MVKIRWPRPNGQDNPGAQCQMVKMVWVVKVVNVCQMVKIRWLRPNGQDNLGVQHQMVKMVWVVKVVKVVKGKGG